MEGGGRDINTPGRHMQSGAIKFVPKCETGKRVDVHFLVYLAPFPCVNDLRYPRSRGKILKSL